MKENNTKCKEILNKVRNEKIYENAEKIVEEAMKDNELTDEQKADIEYQLFQLAIQQKKYDEKNKIAENLVENKNLSDKNKKEVLKSIMKKFRREKNYKEARVFAKRIIDDETEAKISKITVLEILKGIETDARSSNKIIKGIGIKIKELQSGKKINPMKEDKKEKANKPTVKRKIDKKRNELYEEKITETDIGKIAEENCSTVEGCIYIAEVCKYFGFEQLGEKSLKGIRKKFQILSKSENTAIAEADKLLKMKKLIAKTREEWDNVYKILERDTKRNKGEGR